MNIDAETYETGPGRPFRHSVPARDEHEAAVIHAFYAPKKFWSHKNVSYLKSACRIIACVLATVMPTWQSAVLTLALGLAGAEWLGVWEEMGGRG